jgi:hypothetical protein
MKTGNMRKVVLESPYAGDIERNVKYARRAVRDSLSRGEAPIASHLLYTQPEILKDHISEERQWGIDAGLVWKDAAEATVMYIDYGMSEGMKLGLKHAKSKSHRVEFRKIGKNKDFTVSIGRKDVILPRENAQIERRLRNKIERTDCFVKFDLLGLFTLIDFVKDENDRLTQNFIKDIEKNKYKLKKKVHGQEYVVTIGQKRWENLKKKWVKNEM